MTSVDKNTVAALRSVIYFALGEGDEWSQSRPGSRPGNFSSQLLDEADPDEYFRDGLFTKRHQIGPFHLLEVRFAPNFVIPRHHHNLDQLVVVLEGRARQGRRWFEAGEGYYTKAFTPYTTAAGPEGCRIVEVRKDAIEDLEIWWDEDKPERWRRERWEQQ